MSDTTARFALPLLAAGQAQKEINHNEALTLLDLLAQPVAETSGDNSPPGAPVAGKAWIVGASPTGAWAGHAAMLALWTDGGWRFIAPLEGMSVWVKATGLWTRRTASGWSDGTLPAAALQLGGNQVVGARQAAIASPAGGTTIDSQARATLSAILAMLRTHGLIAP